MPIPLPPGPAGPGTPPASGPPQVPSPEHIPWDPRQQLPAGAQSGNAATAKAWDNLMYVWTTVWPAAWGQIVNTLTHRL